MKEKANLWPRDSTWRRSTSARFARRVAYENRNLQIENLRLTAASVGSSVLTESALGRGNAVWGGQPWVPRFANESGPGPCEATPDRQVGFAFITINVHF